MQERTRASSQLLPCQDPATALLPNTLCPYSQKRFRFDRSSLLLDYVAESMGHHDLSRTLTSSMNVGRYLLSLNNIHGNEDYQAPTCYIKYIRCMTVSIYHIDHFPVCGRDTKQIDEQSVLQVSHLDRTAIPTRACKSYGSNFQTLISLLLQQGLTIFHQYAFHTSALRCCYCNPDHDPSPTTPGLAFSDHQRAEAPLL